MIPHWTFYTLRNRKDLQSNKRYLWKIQDIHSRCLRSRDCKHKHFAFHVVRIYKWHWDDNWFRHHMALQQYKRKENQYISIFSHIHFTRCHKIAYIFLHPHLFRSRDIFLIEQFQSFRSPTDKYSLASGRTVGPRLFIQNVNYFEFLF